MSKELQNVLSYIRKMWRRRWLVLGVAILVCAVGWPIVYLIPDKYEVTAKFYLNTQSLLKPLLRGLAVDSSTMEQTTMVIRRTLLSRSNMEKVVRETNMDQEATNPEELERLLKRLADNINMDGGGSEHIYAISYADKDPQRAMRVVEELLDLFVGGAIGETHLDTTSTQQFLNEQIKEYEAKLEAAENNLKEFKRNNMGLMPETGQTYFSQLSMAIDQLNTTKLELEEATNRRNELKRQIQAVKLPGDIPSGPPISPLQDRLDKLLMQYTEQHPEVIALRQLLESQEAPAQTESDSSRIEGQSLPKLRQNFAYQEFMVALGKAEAEVAALKVRLKKYQAKVSQLQKLIDTMPQVEAELAKLNRDYSIIKDNYEEMVRRREAAKITYEAEQSTNDVQFKIIEPPRVPMLPIGPRRLLLLTATLLFGFGAGTGLALFLIQLKPTFYNWRDLQEVVALPVFGAVSLAQTSHLRLKTVAQSVSFWSLLLLLILAFATLATLRILHIEPADAINTLKGSGLL